MNRSLRRAIVTITVAAAPVGFAPAAVATFPGTNGEILYWTNLDFSLRSIHPDGTPARILMTQRQSPPGTFPFDAEFSPDGSTIAVMALGGALGYDRILIANTETGQREVIFRISRHSQDSFIASIAFNPTGDRLMFCAVDLGGPNRARLLTIAVDGSDLTLVSDRSSCLADWSSTNKIVALAGADLRRIVTMDPNGSNQQPVLRAFDDATRLSFGISPSWSPDGSRIVYAAPVGAREQYEVFSIAADGGTRTRLTHRPLRDDLYPLFSPDGTTIAFARSRDADKRPAELYSMVADGSNVQRLTHTAGFTEATRSWQALA